MQMRRAMSRCIMLLRIVDVGEPLDLQRNPHQQLKLSRRQRGAGVAGQSEATGERMSSSLIQIHRLAIATASRAPCKTRTMRTSVSVGR